jgi:hypothetical protein
VDVRVGEPRNDAAAAQVDDLRRRQDGLVRAHPARDPLAGDRERPRDRKCRIQRPDDAVIEDHLSGDCNREREAR